MNKEVMSIDTISGNSNFNELSDQEIKDVSGGGSRFWKEVAKAVGSIVAQAGGEYAWSHRKKILKRIGTDAYNQGAGFYYSGFK